MGHTERAAARAPAAQQNVEVPPTVTAPSNLENQRKPNRQWAQGTPAAQKNRSPLGGDHHGEDHVSSCPGQSRLRHRADKYGWADQNL